MFILIHLQYGCTILNTHTQTALNLHDQSDGPPFFVETEFRAVSAIAAWKGPISPRRSATSWAPQSQKPTWGLGPKWSRFAHTKRLVTVWFLCIVLPRLRCWLLSLGQIPAWSRATVRVLKQCSAICLATQDCIEICRNWHYSQLTPPNFVSVLRHLRLF